MLLGYFPKSFQRYKSRGYGRARDYHEFAMRTSNGSSASAIKVPFVLPVALIGEANGSKTK